MTKTTNYVIYTMLFDQPYFFTETSADDGYWSAELTLATWYSTKKLAQTAISIQDLSDEDREGNIDVFAIPVFVAENKIKEFKQANLDE